MAEEVIDMRPWTDEQTAVLWAVMRADEPTRQEITNARNPDWSGMRVELKVNGQPVSFTAIIREMFGREDVRLKQKAQEMFEARITETVEKASEISFRITEMLKGVESELKRQAHKLIPELRDDEDFR